MGTLAKRALLITIQICVTICGLMYVCSLIIHGNLKPSKMREKIEALRQEIKDKIDWLEQQLPTILTHNEIIVAITAKKTCKEIYDQLTEILKEGEG